MNPHVLKTKGSIEIKHWLVNSFRPLCISVPKIINIITLIDHSKPVTLRQRENIYNTNMVTNIHLS